MFAKDKVSQSMIDAVNSVINEGKVDKSSEKVPTSTGMKVYGSSYGNSAKAHRDQTKHSVDDVKEPTKKDIEKDSKLYQKTYHGTSKHYLRPDTLKYMSKVGEEVKMKEELKGNQHKIDANHNNKIDGQDFKILKAKKKVSEESEKEEGHEDAKQDKSMIKKMMKKEEDDCVTKPEVKTIAKKEVGSHEKKMHKSHVKENIFYNFAKQLQEDKSKGTEPTFTDNNVGEMATSKKNQDIADKAYLKHKPGTLKGQLTQVGRFLRGKPEIKEDVVDESVQTQATKTGDKITTDTLSGRMPGGKLNSFKNYKVDLTTSGVEAVPKEFDNGVDTKEKQKITTSPGPIDIKMDDKLAKKSTQKEEFEAVEEKVIAGMSGFKKIKGADEKGNVTDKSGAVHTPMSRAKSAAKLSFAKLKQEMLGKISN